jgi:hypothetical protein
MPLTGCYALNVLFMWLEQLRCSGLLALAVPCQQLLTV